MKNLLTTIVFLSLLFNGLAQENWCGFDAKMQEAFNENPALENQIYEHFDRIASGQITPEERADPIIIPVVVHILHDGDNGNISDAQVYDAIRMLNDDYNRLNADTVDTRNTTNAPFQPIAANVNVEFRLAKIDPDGNCTNGIERRSSAEGSFNANDDNAKFYAGGGLDAWDRNKYFNIWVVNSIENTDGVGVILGYGQFPMWGAADTYGFVIRHDAFGSIGTASGDRTVTHELGHCLGLFHTFQSGCGSNGSSCSSQGDGCCDTPPVDDPHWSCLNSQNNCSQIPNGDYYGFDAFDQYENYMSYSPCQNMFSEDQKSIILGNISTINFLSNLTSLSNQIATGVTLPDELCSSKFVSDRRVICEGESINFSDISFHGVSSRQWTFNSGTPSTATDSTATITYNTPGTYPVSLVVSDGTNNSTIDSINYISVLPNPGQPLPFVEGFETMSSFPDYNQMFSHGSFANNVWQLDNTHSSTGQNCIFLNNYNNDSGNKVEFSSTSIDLSSVPNGEEILLSFDYAYKKIQVSDFEFLKIYGTTDCGESWTLFKTITSDDLAGDETATQAFEPEQADWKNKTITVYPFFQTNNTTFRFKMVFESQGGNNLFLDNINLFTASQLNVIQTSQAENLSVYPNPTQNVVTLNYSSYSNQDVTISIYNSLGEIVETSYIGELKVGENKFNLDLSPYQKGIYYVNINGDQISKTIKLIKN